MNCLIAVSTKKINVCGFGLGAVWPRVEHEKFKWVITTFYLREMGAFSNCIKMMIIIIIIRRANVDVEVDVSAGAVVL